MSYDFRQGRPWRKAVKLALRQAGYRCHWCGGVATQGDHLVPVALGGSHLDPANIVASCAHCNQSRGGSGGPPKSVPSGGTSVFSGSPRCQ